MRNEENEGGDDLRDLALSRLALRHRRRKRFTRGGRWEWLEGSGSVVSFYPVATRGTPDAAAVVATSTASIVVVDVEATIPPGCM